MLVVTSKNCVPIRLTQERWKHITSRHPEMKGQRKRLLETIADPHLIQEGDSGELMAVREYSKTPQNPRFLVVAYRETTEDDGFVLTAYFVGGPSLWRETVWKQ